MEPIRGLRAAPIAETKFSTNEGARTPRETAQEFEAVFIGQMTRLMMESVEIGESFSGGHGEEMFRGVLAEQIGKQISLGGGIGLAPHVLDQIIRLQGGSGK